MNFTLQIPSLQQLVRVKIAAHLWNQADMSTLAPEFLNESKKKVMRDKMLTRVSALSIPVQCKNLLLNLMDPLETELLDWYCFHQVNHADIIRDRLPQQLHWTMLGTVDYQKTAELIVKNEKLDVLQRYKLACCHCLEAESRDLIQRIPANEKKLLDYRYANNFGYRQADDLTIFWTCIINDQVDEMQKNFQKRGRAFCMRSFNRHMVDCAIKYGYEAAREYYFDKLSPREKDQVIVEIAFTLIHVPRNRNLLGLLRRMSEKQQDQLFQRGFGQLMICLTFWPWQDLFMETAERGWHFLDKLYYGYLMERIAGKISRGCKDYNYVRMFADIWLMSSVDYKQHFLNNNNCAPGTLEFLFHSQEEDVIQLILREKPSLRVKALVGRDLKLYYEMRVSSRWNLEHCAGRGGNFEAC